MRLPLRRASLALRLGKHHHLDAVVRHALRHSLVGCDHLAAEVLALDCKGAAAVPNPAKGLRRISAEPSNKKVENLFILDPVPMRWIGHKYVRMRVQDLALAAFTDMSKYSSTARSTRPASASHKLLFCGEQTSWISWLCRRPWPGDRCRSTLGNAPVPIRCAYLSIDLFAPCQSM